MADALRATRSVPGFHAALRLHLIEASPVLRATQSRRLAPLAPTFHDSIADLPEGPLERREGLEQLRFLENRIPVRCVQVDARGRAFWELNNPSDIPLIEDIMKREGLA